MRFEWDLRDRHFQMEWGIPGTLSRKELQAHYWNDVPHDVLRAKKYSHYLRNDPHPELARDLARHLAAVAMGQDVDTEGIDGLNFLLHFVHRLDYIRDPELPHDYPRYPGETIVFYGGDCEDSAMLFAALASYWGHRTCLHRFVGRRHIAAGVVHPEGRGVQYTVDGVDYLVAETAVSGRGYVDVGEPFSISKGAKSVVVPLPPEDTGIEPITMEPDPEPTIMITRTHAGMLTLKSGAVQIDLEKPTVVGRREFESRPGSETVSRKQARFFHDAGRWFVMALPATNPTAVNGTELEEYRRCEIKNGDRVKMGKIEVAVTQKQGSGS